MMPSLSFRLMLLDLPPHDLVKYSAYEDSEMFTGVLLTKHLIKISIRVACVNCRLFGLTNN